MSDSSGSQPSSKSNPVLNCFGIGCAALILIPLFAFAVASGGGGFISFLLVGGLVLFVVLRSRKQGNELSQPISTPTIADSKYAARLKEVADQSDALRSAGATLPGPVASSSGDGTFENPICVHKFTAEALQASHVTCVCGKTFRSADILQYAKLNSQVETLQQKISKLTLEMRERMYDALPSVREVAAKAAPATTVAEPVSRAASPVPAEPVKPAEPAKPAKPAVVKATRPKVVLSLQQWLIIGAAALVMVAASIFVGNGLRDNWPPQAFAGVTLGLSVAMAFGAFKLKSISATLVNFMAVFSASMVTASLMILGDQISTGTPNDFTWDTAPAWWWAISMVLLSLTTTGLARFSGNFGFKVIGLLSAASSVAFFVVGHALTALALPFDLFGVYVAAMSLAAVGILYQAKFLLGIKREVVTDKNLKAYAKQLAEREDKALKNFALIAAGLLAAIGVAIGVVQAGSSLLTPGNPFALLSIAAVWLLLGIKSDSWSSLLTEKGKPAAFAKPLASGLITASVMLASVSAATLIQDTLAKHLVALTALAVIVWFSNRLGSLAPSGLVTQLTMWLSVALYIVWSLTSSSLFTVATFLIGLSLLLTVVNLRTSTLAYQVPAVALSALGLVGIALDQQRAGMSDATSPAFAGVAVALVVATLAQPILQAVVAKRLKQEPLAINYWVAFAFAAVLVVMHLQVLANQPMTTLAGKVNFLAAFLVYSVVAKAISLSAKFGGQLRWLLLAHGYLGQVITVVTIFAALPYEQLDVTPVATWLLLAIALINYGYGLISKANVQLQFGFIAAMSVFYLNQLYSNAAGSARVLNLQLIVVLLAIAVHLFVWKRRFKNVSTELLNGVTLLGILLGFIITFATNASGFAEELFVNQLSSTITLAGLAIVTAAVGEWFDRKKFALANALILLSALYSAFAFAVNLISSASATKDQVLSRWLITTLTLGVISLRQVARSKGLDHLVVAYLANIASAVLLASLTGLALGAEATPEPYSLWIAAALVGTTLLTKSANNPARSALLVDVPVLGVGLTSLVYAFNVPIDSNESILRALLASLLIAGFGYLRSAKHNGWLAVGYLLGVNAAVWLAQGIHVWFNFNFDGPEGITVLIALSVFLGNLVLVKRINATTRDFRVGVLLAIVAIPSLAYSLVAEPTLLANQLRQLISLVAISAYAVALAKRTRSNQVWLALSYLSNAGVFVSLGNSVLSWSGAKFDGPEFWSVAIALSVVLSHLLLKAQIQKLGELVKVAVPFAVATLPSLFYSLAFEPSASYQGIRRVIALALITAYSYRLIRTTKNNTSMVVGLASSSLTMFFAAALAVQLWLPDYRGPEFYSVLITAGILLTNLVAKAQLKNASELYKLGLPTAVLALPSLVYSLLNAPEDGQNLLRRVIALLVIAAFATYFTRKTDQPRAWAIGSYVTTAVAMFALANASYVWFNISFNGPEIYAAAVSAGILLTQRLTYKQYQPEGSLFTWGLPLAVLLVPSTLYTYVSLQVPFAQLTAIEVIRVIAVLAVSAGLLVLGVRRGNLAGTSIGLLGLGLVLVPGTAVHSNELLPGAQIESTSLVVGALIFVLLNMLHKKQIVKGTSVIYLGIPVSIMLAPALLNSLTALGNPELASVDWWRFGLVLVAGLTLLIVGALRELAGMFYPGLVAVLLTALPYGFKQTQDQAWFLWAILLLVAAVMVWVAVRLEQIKKAGRTSSAWLKELK